MVENTTKTILIDNNDDASALYGIHDKNLRLIRSEMGVDIIARDGMVKISGDDDRVKTTYDVLESLLNIVKSSGELHDKDLQSAINHKTSNPPQRQDTESNDQEVIDVFCKGTSVKPKTTGQRNYVDAIRKNDLVFCIGPAGSGKTYLAVALAISALKNNLVKKIVLARPAVEAGERLGFLPGDIHAKVNPYLRPLYDALANMMDTVQVKKYIETDLIEILPLAFMRGRTLNNSFIILDEAQNCSSRQMKTFLTRLGFHSRIVVTGDITQIDLPEGEVSGLIDVREKLRDVQGISFVNLDKRDIIRHKLIEHILDAYERG